MDLHTNEGLWYVTPEFCLARGVAVRKVIQKPGDVIILGPGTLHWVRSYGVALQSAWNFMPRNIEQLQRAAFREQVNREISFKYNIVPLKALLLDYLQQEADIMPRDMRAFIGTHLGK